jgi:hypothetical protein
MFFLSFSPKIPYLPYFAVRVIAFALREAVSRNDTSINLYITAQVFYAGGFFAEINVSYTLMKKW